ncbi:intermembrane transport protein PqiB [Alteromonas oceanisediminis]|uniref:intermembrane transport protein PqiB n=1 Tax=Alteromonas oceanisediminis TaxID=2836180 RepID=UPI001BDAE7BD|nr:intermembrane transport protein PqiB [Alteromonas oceanisediminis]MBT0587623.1 intermembrane transport protein PqiB [Alteromonas oceanisediminis]
MTEPLEQSAIVKPAARFSKVWFIPIVALLIGLWMVFQQWLTQGPLITIEFQSATGIEVNKTPIKAKDLDVGIVKSIELKPDLTGVIITARMDNTVNELLTTDTEFWVVSPRVSFSGVSGLNTLLSGSYIAMEPANNGQQRSDFIGLERPPVTPLGTPGLHVTLNSADEFAFKEGDPIVYKGFKVGEFEDIYFNIEERVVYYNAFIEAPYHKLITENTRFWNVSGVKFNLASSGISVETGSLETLLTNGVTFGIPPGSPAGEQINKRTHFDIYSSFEAAADERFKLAAEFMLLIDDTVRGLTVGAPVEYRGIQIGEVLAINAVSPLPGTMLEKEYAIPVLINIYPGKVRQPDNQAGLEFVRRQINRWVENDLRATLRVGNFLTGGLFVDLQHVKNPQPFTPIALLDYDYIPSASNEFTQITQKVDALLNKLNSMPLDDVVADIQQVIAAMSATAESVAQTSQNFDDKINQFDIATLNQQIEDVTAQMQQLLADYAEGSATYSNVNGSMRNLQDTLREIQPILIRLKEKPNGLLFGDSSQEDIQPQRKGDRND